MQRLPLLAFAMALAYAPAIGAQTRSDQSSLKVNTAISGPTLTFDWPALQIGVGTYEEGPTGLTIFRFANKGTAVVDVRGGAPGTVNTDALRLGYDDADLDAIVFAGGSAYGEEAITAVQTGLKDAGESSGRWGNIGFAAGAIIYDFGGHRLNEIYPDKRLAQAALRQLRPGVFPLGAQGAGRMPMQGSFFGCGAHSGQGGAFRQVGNIKIAAFTVVNAVGAVVDRSGKLVKCHRNAAWRSDEGVSELLARVGTGTLLSENTAPAGNLADAGRAGGPTKATTISLVVTNRKMTSSELQRLAVQVQTGMGRAIQPYATASDGDTLYAVSTQEVDVPQETLSNLQLNTMAGELMWDAVLASVPPEPPAAPTPDNVAVSADRLRRLVGSYDFGAQSPINITFENGSLGIGSDKVRFFDIPQGATARLVAASNSEFYVAGRYGTRISFTTNKSGKVTGAIINPGPWQQHGVRLK